MALFKISKGSKANLPAELTEGFCWYTHDDSKFYIDHKDENGVLVRKALNAQEAESLTGYDIATILNSSDVEIPTSAAVFDALEVLKAELTNQSVAILAEAQADASNKAAVVLAEAQAYTDAAVANSAGPTDVVKYTEQTLTDEQKAQARENIGAASIPDASNAELDGVALVIKNGEWVISNIPVADKSDLASQSGRMDYIDGRVSALEEASASTTEYNRVNVRDYGAVGDGVTDDQPAIWEAWQVAKELILQGISCELYFPSGTYGILQGGFGFHLPSGYGGLRVTGAGRETTTIKYLEGWTLPYTPPYGSQTYVFDIRPADDAGVYGDADTYLHDINISGFTFYDSDPIGNATSSEETHGVLIKYCQRVSVTDCQFIATGDEAVDIISCSDAIVTNNRFEGCPGAGQWGGAISIGDGSDGVVVMGNTINGSVDGKDNVGITVEGFYSLIQNVVISNNVIRNIHGAGISFGAGHEGSRLYNVLIADNVVQGCDTGVTGGTNYPKECVSIVNNHFLDCVSTISGYGFGIKLEGGHDNLIIRGNVIRNTSGDGINLNGSFTINGVLCANTVLIECNTLENIGAMAMYITDGEYIIRDCIVKGTGVVNASGRAAIYAFHPNTTEYSVYRCRLTGIRQKIAMEHVTEVEDTYIEMVDANGNPVTYVDAYPFINGSKLKRLVNCQLCGFINIAQDNAVVQGNTITNGYSWVNGLTINANGVIVSGNRVTTVAKLAIVEKDGKNNNLFMGNVCNTAITPVGANSLAINNINTSNTSYTHTNTVPTASAADNGKILQVVDGKWTAVEIANGNEVAY